MTDEMTNVEWKENMDELLDGVEDELCRSAPKKAHSILQEFRQRVARVKFRRERRAIERELEAVMKSAAYFRAAGRRHIAALCEPVIPMLEELVELLDEHNRKFPDFRWTD